MEEKRIEEQKQEKQAIDSLFEDYRKSGLALMTTAIGLSSGAFYGLFQSDSTRRLSFVYLIPIAVALIQQLSYYIGCRFRAQAEFHGFICKHTDYLTSESPDSEYAEKSMEASATRLRSEMYFELSDIFCAGTIITLCALTLVPILIYGTRLASVGFIIAIVFCSILWWWKYRNTTKKIQDIEP